MTVPFASQAEATLLRACARRLAQAADHRVAFDFVADAIDWDHLLVLAQAHGVTDLLLAPLTSGALPVPPRIVESLKNRFVEVTAQNLKRTTQLIGLMERLASHEIRAVAFKGPTLAAGIYGHLGRRLSTDLDLLLDYRDASRARAVMLADGYTLPRRPRHKAGSLLYGLYPRAGRTDILVPPLPWQTEVDLQVAVANWPQAIQLNTAELIDRSVIVELAGHPVRTLCPDDLLLALAIHGKQHGWVLLRCVSDIDAVSAWVNDWDAVVNRARTARMLRTLWVALLVSRDVLDTPLPPAVAAAAMADRDAREIAAGVTARLFDPARDPSVEWHPPEWLASLQDRRRDKLRFHARTLVHEWFLKWPWDEWLGRRHHSRDGSRDC